MNTKFYFIICLVIFFAACETTNEELEKDTVKIGVILPLTGPNANSGIAIWRGMVLATEQINEAIQSYDNTAQYASSAYKEIELITKDSEGNTEVAKQKFRELRDEQVIGIAGEYSSGNTIELAKMAIAEDMFLINGSSTAPSISNIESLERTNLIWRLVPSDIHQAEILANKIKQDAPNDKVSIIYIDDGWGNGIHAAFKTHFGNQNIASVGYTVNEEGLIDADALSSKIEQLLHPSFEEPEAIMMFVYSRAAAQISRSKEFKEYLVMHPDVKIYTADGNWTQNFINNADPELLSRVRVTSPVPPPNSPFYELFIHAYEERYGEVPELYTETGYDIIYTIVYALWHADNQPENLPLTSAVIAENFAAITEEKDGIETININNAFRALEIDSKGESFNYDGASGAIEFDDNGDINQGTYGIWVVRNEKFELESTVEIPN